MAALRILLLIALAGWTGAAGAASLAELRAAALEAVNADREAHGLPTLEPAEALDEAALAHAEDMRQRDYFAHESPEGRSVMDRYRAAGGERWRKVGENIARCGRCGAPDVERVRSFEEGWMNSPEHRANILDPGYRRFGFGMVGEGGEQYAVQTFSGPGQTQGDALEPAALAERAVAAVNEERSEAGAPPLQGSEALSRAAREVLEARLPDGELRGAAREALDRLGGGWREVAVLIGECGGCGAETTAADVERFLRNWSQEPGYRRRLRDAEFSELGFALWTDGAGRKVALALLGR